MKEDTMRVTAVIPRKDRETLKEYTDREGLKFSAYLKRLLTDEALQIRTMQPSARRVMNK